MQVKPFVESVTIIDLSEKPLDIGDLINPVTLQAIVHYDLWIKWLSSFGDANEICKAICHLSKEDSASLNNGLMRPLSFGDNFEQILYENIEY